MRVQVRAIVGEHRGGRNRFTEKEKKMSQTLGMCDGMGNKKSGYSLRSQPHMLLDFLRHKK